MKLGKYSILRKLATGGMAEIFLARSDGVEGFQKDVVIKRILPIHDDNPDLIDMFLDEARISSTLNHPNVVQVYELGKERGQYFIVMEYVHGEDLRRTCERGLEEDDFLPMDFACKIISDAALGLHYAHTKTDPHGVPLHIVHRDVSPQNILIGFDGTAKVTDFGIAKAENKASTTRTGQLKGKFSYMSPEQCLGKPIDQRSDIFSLGTVLYEVTLCTRLFKAENELKAIGMIARGRIPPPRELRPDFPPELEAIIMKALEREPDARYPTAQAMHLDLERFLARDEPLSRVAIGGYMRGLFPERLVPEGTPDKPYIDEDAPTRTFNRSGLLGAMAMMKAQGHREREDDTTQRDNPIIDADAAFDAPAHSQHPQGHAQTPEGEATALHSDTHPTASAPEPRPAPAEPRNPAKNGASMQPNVSPGPPQQPNPFLALQELREQHQRASSAALQPAMAQPTPQPLPAPMGQPAAPASPPAARVPEPIQASPMSLSGGGGPGGDLHSPDPGGGGGGGGWDDDDWDDDEDFEAELLLRKKKNRNIIIGVTVLAIGAIFVMMFVLEVGVFEAAQSNTPEDPEIIGGQEEIVPLATVDAKVSTTPAGAHIVINGVLQEQPTPGTYSFVQGEPNSVLFLKKDHHSVLNYIPGGALRGDITATLPPLPQPPPEGEEAPPEDEAPKEGEEEKPKLRRGDIIIKPQLPEHAGAKVFFDGEEVGSLEEGGTTVKAAVLGEFHHVLVRKAGFADYSVLIQALSPFGTQIHVYLTDTEERPLYKTHKSEVSFAVEPPTVKINVNDEESGAKSSSVYPKAKLLNITMDAAGYRGEKMTIDTTGAGNFLIQASLPTVDREPFKVSINVPQGEYWFPCLAGVTENVCWESRGTRSADAAFRELPAGTYNLTVSEITGTHVKENRRSKTKAEIEFQPNMQYIIDVSTFTPENEITFAMREGYPMPWDRAAEMAEKAKAEAEKKKQQEKNK